jgi:chaperone required for assembly of F1-ATPase
MTWNGAKRVYEKAATTAAENGFAVTLDGRAVRTPGGASLTVPSEALAVAIAGEWAAQEETIDPHSMPLTQLACTAFDRVGPRRDAVVDHTAAYGATDLLCYRADQPEDLRKRQDAAWQPLLDWAEDTYGAPLRITAGIIPAEQPPASVKALEEAVAAHGNLELAALSGATQACGSLIVGLALTSGHLDAEGAFAVSQLDERYQSETWGKDAEAEARRVLLQTDIGAAAQFLDLLRDGG